MILREQTSYENSPSYPRRETFIAEYELGGVTTLRRTGSRTEEGPTWERKGGRDDTWGQTLPERAAQHLEAQYQKGDYHNIESLDEREANVRSR